MTFGEVRALWGFDNPAELELVFSNLLSTCADDDRAVVLTQRARAQGMQRRFDDARVTLALAFTAIEDENSEASAAYWIELGRVENSSGEAAVAVPHFVKSLEVAQKIGAEFLAVDAAHMLGIAEKGEAGLEWNLKAIAMAEATTDEKTRDWLGSLLNNTGWIYYERGDYEKALSLFSKALGFRISKGKQPPILIARYAVGKCLRAMGETSEALTLQQDLEREHLEIGNEPGYVYEEIAECLYSLGREDESRPYFKKAYDVLSKDEWLIAEQPARVERLGKLAMNTA